MIIHWRDFMKRDSITIIDAIIIIVLFFLADFIVMHDIEKISVKGTGELLDYYQNDYKFTKNEKENLKNILNGIDLYDMDNLKINDDVKLIIMINKRKKTAVGRIEVTGKYINIEDIENVFYTIDLINKENRSGTLFYSSQFASGVLSGTTTSDNTFTLVLHYDLYIGFKDYTFTGNDLSDILYEANKRNSLNKMYQILILYSIFLILFGVYKLIWGKFIKNSDIKNKQK